MDLDGNRNKEKGLNERLSFTVPVTWNFTNASHNDRSYWSVERFFKYLEQDLGTTWFFSYRRQCILGFDSETRRFIGSIGPKGFGPNDLSPADRFDARSESHQIFTAANVAYMIDFRSRMSTVFFTAPAGENISVVQDIRPKNYNWEYTVLASERSVYMLTPDGKLVWKAPYERDPRDYPRMEVSLLESPDQFALWLMPLDNRKLPIHVDWLTRGQGVVKSMDLPRLPQPPAWDDPWRDRILIVMPPIVMAVWGKIFHEAITWHVMRLRFVVSALCAIAGWLIGRRYKPRLAVQLGWGLFHLLFGLPGLLAFLSVQEWPAREPCPNCKRLRTVAHEQCEHCGAAFAPPQRNGTEIFEDLSLRSS
jgi:hypothetical protein